MVTFEDIVDVAPDLENEDPERVTRFIARAGRSVSAPAWGSQERADDAVTYLAAHLLTMRRLQSDVSGPVSSKKEGDLAVTYATGTSDEGTLQMTPYGREYLRLRKQILTTPLVG